MPHYRTALEIEEKLSQAEPANGEARVTLPYSHDIGVIFNKQGPVRRSARPRSAEVGVERRERRATGDPRDAHSRSGVGVGLFPH